MRRLRLTLVVAAIGLLAIGALVGQPSTVDKAANRGKQKIVIYLATLLKTGAAPSTPD